MKGKTVGKCDNKQSTISLKIYTNQNNHTFFFFKSGLLFIEERRRRSIADGDQQKNMVRINVKMAKLKNHDNLLRNKKKKKSYLLALYNGILRGDIFHGFTFPCALFHSVTVLHTYVFMITYVFFGVYKSKSEISNKCWHIVSSRVDSEFCFFFPFTLNNVLVSKFSAIR